MGSSTGSSSVSVGETLPRGRSMGIASPIFLSGELFRKSYSLSAEGGNLTLSLVRESTKSRSSWLAPRDARDGCRWGMSDLKAEGKALSASAVRSVHWMGMENRWSVTTDKCEAFYPVASVFLLVWSPLWCTSSMTSQDSCLEQVEMIKIKKTSKNCFSLQLLKYIDLHGSFFLHCVSVKVLKTLLFKTD